MNAIQSAYSDFALLQLNEKLTSLNKSIRGGLPTLDARRVHDIYTLTLTSTAMAWNWSKSFSPLTG